MNELTPKSWNNGDSLHYLDGQWGQPSSSLIIKESIFLCLYEGFMICPVCENKKQLASMEMSPEIVEEMASAEPIADYCGDELLRERLKICNNCSNLLDGMTCSVCGCFVQFRARHLSAHCAFNLW